MLVWITGSNEVYAFKVYLQALKISEGYSAQNSQKPPPPELLSASHISPAFDPSATAMPFNTPLPQPKKLKLHHPARQQKGFLPNTGCMRPRWGSNPQSPVVFAVVTENWRPTIRPQGRVAGWEKVVSSFINQSESGRIIVVVLSAAS